MSFEKINETNRDNITVLLKSLFSSIFIITAIVVGVTPIVLDVNNNNSFSILLFVSAFAQPSSEQQIQIDYNSLQISDGGQIQGKIIMMYDATPTMPKERGGGITTEDNKPIQQITIKAIGVGQTSIHCLNIDDNNKHQVRTSQPFLATAQKSMTLSQKNTAFILQLNPNEGNVNCDKLSVVAGPTTTFSNVAVVLSSR